jgi:hypothetical protein
MVMNFQKRESEREISLVQPVSAPFATHEWCLKSNKAAHTVVYVRDPEPAAVFFFSNMLHRLYIFAVLHLLVKCAVDYFVASCIGLSSGLLYLCA